MNKIKWLAVSTAFVLVLGLLAGCGCSKQPAVTPTGENLQPNEGTEIATQGAGTNGSTVESGAATDKPVISESVDDWDDAPTPSGSSQASEPSNVPATSRPSGNDQPTGTTTPSQPSGGSTGSTTPSTDQTTNGKVSYAEYMAMSNADKQAYFNSFGDPDLFYDWLDAAEAEYKNANKDNTITGDGTIDVSKSTGGK